MTHSQQELKEAFEKSLDSLADVALEHYSESKPNLNDESLLNALVVLQTVLHDKMFDMCDELNLNKDEREQLAFDFGTELKLLVFKYTNIDTHELVKKLYPDNNDVS